MPAHQGAAAHHGKRKLRGQRHRRFRRAGTVHSGSARRQPLVRRASHGQTATGHSALEAPRGGDELRCRAPGVGPRAIARISGTIEGNDRSRSHIMTRRRLLKAGLTACALPLLHARESTVAEFDRARVLRAADRYLAREPVTVTASHSPRSAGGLHDFFSEGDYWWPDPKNPDGPYLQRDGMSNPDNFVAHRRALMDLSVQMPALTAAWHLTRDRKYAAKAAGHLRAWFIDGKTRMNPDLQYAQAIHGRTTGRGTGVIDTIHLVEVAQAIAFVPLSPAESDAVKAWFAEYLTWITTSKNGMEERDTKNNHATCWGMQAAAFAKLTGNRRQMEDVKDRYKTIYIPKQEAPDGSFPAELARTKPYGYSLFNLEAMAAICQILSDSRENLWKWETPGGRGIAKAIAFLYPFIENKSKWVKPPDVMYFEDWPMRQSALLFGGIALNKPEYIAEWKKLPADSDVEEVVRNFFIRQPVLWVTA